MKRTIHCAAMLGAFISLAAFAAHEVDARGGRSGAGAARGSASTSMSRGGGGNGGGFSRSGNYSKPTGGTRQASAGQRPSQQPSGNRNNVNTGNKNNISGGNNVNTGNINTGDVNINRNVHVDNDLPGGYYGGWHDYPIARGVAIGAVAVTTAAVIGSAYYALPPACSPYPWHTYTYYYCGSVYYKPQYEGDKVVYVVVSKPK